MIFHPKNIDRKILREAKDYIYSHPECDKRYWLVDDRGACIDMSSFDKKEIDEIARQENTTVEAIVLAYLQPDLTEDILKKSSEAETDPARVRSAEIFHSMTKEDISQCLDVFESIHRTIEDQEQYLVKQYRAFQCDLNYLLGLVLQAA